MEEEIKFYALVDYLLVLQNAIDDLGSKASHIVHGGEFAWRQNHTRIGVDRQWQSNVHVHVIQPVIVGLRNMCVAYGMTQRTQNVWKERKKKQTTIDQW